MKKDIFAIVLAFIALVVGGIALGYYLTTPGYIPEEQQEIVVNDSVVTTNVTTQLTNPVFSSVEEVLRYQSDEWNRLTVDSIFNNIPSDVLEMVARVKLGRLSTVSKKELVIEYLQHHQDIYKYIVSEDTAQLPPARAVTEILQRDSADTVINGKPYKLLTPSTE